MRRRRKTPDHGMKPGDRIIYCDEKLGVISSWLLPGEPRRGCWIRLDENPEVLVEVGQVSRYLRLEI